MLKHLFAYKCTYVHLHIHRYIFFIIYTKQVFAPRKKESQGEKKEVKQNCRKSNWEAMSHVMRRMTCLSSILYLSLYLSISFSFCPSHRPEIPLFSSSASFLNFFFSFALDIISFISPSLVSHSVDQEEDGGGEWKRWGQQQQHFFRKKGQLFVLRGDNDEKRGCWYIRLTSLC